MKTKNFILTVAILLLSVLSQVASAFDFTVDGICYIINGNNAAVTSDYGSDPYEGDIVIPETVSWEGNVYPVTAIYRGAFSYREITSLTIPASVIAVSGGAFLNTQKLTSIDVDNNNPSFSSSNGILFNKEKTTLIAYPAGKTETTYMIPNSVTDIGEYSFYRCANLTTISMSGVKTIEYSAFFECSGLVSITLSESITKIGSSAFDRCTALTSVALPKLLTIIENYTFYDCHNLTSVIFSESLTTIGNAAFNNCRNLMSITLPESLETLGMYAFSGCTFSSVKIPRSLISIKGNSLGTVTTIEVDDDHPNFSTMDGVLYNKDKTILALYPVTKKETAFVVPGSVATIEDYAFQRCYNLKEIDFSDSLKRIGYASFEGSGLVNVTIPASVEYIDAWAFTKCGLKSIIFEGTVEHVDGAVFADTQFSIIEVKSEPFKIENSLSYVTLENKTLIVPDGMKNLFLAAPGWQDFGTILEKSQVVFVTSITGVPTEVTAGERLTLAGKVIPEDATWQTIVWSVNDAGTTGAWISNDNTTLVTSHARTETVEITATIANGISVGINYTQKFSITVNAKTGITETAQQSNPVYPNPTSGMVYTGTESDIKVYNSQGALLQSILGSQVDLSVYPQGLYFLQINGEIKKVIKK